MCVDVCKSRLWGTFLSHIDGSVVYESTLHRHRQCDKFHNYLYCAILFCLSFVGCVHFTMERSCVSYYKLYRRDVNLRIQESVLYKKSTSQEEVYQNTHALLEVHFSLPRWLVYSEKLFSYMFFIVLYNSHHILLRNDVVLPRSPWTSSRGGLYSIPCSHCLTRKFSMEIGNIPSSVLFVLVHISGFK
jgi:hypothetical protein